MIIVLAGNALLAARVGRALASHLPHVAVLKQDYFLPVEDQTPHASETSEEAPAPPWLAGTMAMSAQRIAAHGGTSVVVLPQLEDVSSFIAGFEQITVSLYLFLLRKPTRPQGIFRRAGLIATDGVDCETMAQEIIACTARGTGLVRPAPSGTGADSLLPTAGGPCTGVDIIEIPRIARVVERYGDRFLHRVYTKAEQALYRGRIPELAARFAAKEAISKALGTGIWGIRWREMEVLPDMRGKPLVYLHGAAAARARTLNLRHFEISLSHSREYAVAVVMAT